MHKKLIGSLAVLATFSVYPSHACMQVGANFWNIGWQNQSLYSSSPWGNWNSTFISQIQIYSSLRFMDWNDVNTLTAGKWADRVQKSEGCTQCANSNRAIAYEWQIDIVNHVPGCAYWLNVPTEADSEYITNLAKLVFTNLESGRRVYLEYANETWWEPASYDYLTDIGGSIGFTTDKDGGTIINGVWGRIDFLGHTHAAAEMWHWFRQSWKAAGGDPNLCIRVLAGQAGWGNGEEAHFMLEAITDSRVNPWKEKCDAFAIAPYGKGTSHEPMLQSHYQWTKPKGVALVCYEGGPEGQCDPATMTQYLSTLDKYIDGPYNQYTHSGGNWGAVDNGYYSALADWANSHQCNPVFNTKPGPVAVVKVDHLSGSIPFTVMFDGSQSTGSSPSFAWNFGDGATSTVQKPQHTYTTAGSFTVRLIVTDATGSDSATTIVSVVDPSSEPPVRIINDATVGTGVNQFDFSGVWNTVTDDAYASDEHYSVTPGASYTVRFYGAQVKLYGTKDAHHGIATVSIDNGTAVDVDFYAATRAAIGLLWTSPALPKGNHSITITNSGRKNAASTGMVIVGDRVDIYQSADGSIRVVQSNPTLYHSSNGIHSSEGMVELINVRGCKMTAGSTAQRSNGVYIAKISNHGSPMAFRRVVLNDAMSR